MLKGLAGKVFRGLTANRSAYREAVAFLNSPSLPEDAVRERLPLYLRSRSWHVRNVAVKLIAGFKDASFYPVLIQKVRNGSDVGIITRNSITSIRRLGLKGPDVEEALRRALGAGYWEARCEAALALAELFEPSPERAALLAGVLKPRPNPSDPRQFGERNAEVRAAAAVALGRSGNPGITLPALKLLSNDPHWLVRHQAAVALVEISQMHNDLAPEVRKVLDRIDILSDGCRSDFPFPRTVASLRKILLNGLAVEEPAEIRRHYIDMNRGWNRKW